MWNALIKGVIAKSRIFEKGTVLIFFFFFFFFLIKRAFV